MDSVSAVGGEDVRATLLQSWAKERAKNKLRLETDEDSRRIYFPF